MEKLILCINSVDDYYRLEKIIKEKTTLKFARHFKREFFVAGDIFYPTHIDCVLIDESGVMAFSAKYRTRPNTKKTSFENLENDLISLRLIAAA